MPGPIGLLFLLILASAFTAGHAHAREQPAARRMSAQENADKVRASWPVVDANLNGARGILTLLYGGERRQYTTISELAVYSD